MRHFELLFVGLILGHLLTTVGPAEAEPPYVKVKGSCSRGEILVYEGSGEASCASWREVAALPSCSEGEFLTTYGSGVNCVGGSSSSWGIRGLLPHCSTDEIVVSEGFGKWKCSPRRKKK